MSSLHREDVSRLRAEIRARQAVTLIEAAAARGELLERAIEGLTDEQVAAIPQALSLAAELAALVELVPGYEPGTDLFTVAEVLKLDLAGARL